MKKLLLLGGSAQQVIAIETAKKLGYYTVLCDYLTDNPGQYSADKFYLVSTTDKEAVLEVAKNENIDGILAYASDPAAPTATYVGEKLGLPTNPYNAAYTLCNKDKFREYLHRSGLNAPLADGYSDKETACNDKDKFNLPVIIKPVDSCSSKGATVLHSWDELEQAIDFAFSFSRSHRIIIEEFIEKKHEYLIGGDVFVENGIIKLWGFMNCHRDSSVNPLVPVGKSFPLLIEEDDFAEVKKTLQKIVTDLKIQSGCVNVELVVDKNNRVFPIDVGPRAGGNMIPELLGMIYDVDLVKLSVLAAMGEPTNICIGEGNGYYATHNLHSNKDGKYKDITFSDELEKYIIRKSLYKKVGDEVEFFDHAAKALGIIFMKFDSKEEMANILKNINNHYSVNLQ